jgi:hypothetical protein
LEQHLLGVAVIANPGEYQANVCDRSYKLFKALRHEFLVLWFVFISLSFIYGLHHVCICEHEAGWVNDGLFD